nr:YppG family protein [uncultured Bacillus sp.]
MYGHMPNHYYDNGSYFMPFQRSAVPRYRQQPYLLTQGMNGFLTPPVNPFVTSQAMLQNYPPFSDLDPHFQPAINGSPQAIYQQPNGIPAQQVFQNPLYSPEQEAAPEKQAMQPNGYPFMNPYPKASFLAKQPSGMKTVLNSFKAQDGSLDINKMVDTAGQMISAVNQVSSVVKNFGGMFKG